MNSVRIGGDVLTEFYSYCILLFVKSPLKKSPSPNGLFARSVVESFSVVLEKKIFVKFRRCLFAISLLFSFGRPEGQFS